MKLDPRNLNWSRGPTERRLAWPLAALVIGILAALAWLLIAGISWLLLR